ncbi:hypothetical protein GCM10010412_050250 [Nonomuraea recticatena]|uniref:Uncharacterized protein n=1 Tax=Nonomuraea recticatena TaxID=46178 RepID=A0ABN3SAT1_9ACTN
MPAIMPRFMPNVSLATVEACLPGGAVETAVATATAKKVATTRPATKRPASRTG